MDNWVAEFFLRRQQNSRVNVSLLLSAMNPVDSNDCVKLKITAVLRDISNTLIRGTVNEGTLDLLEILEKLLLQEHLVIMESFKSSYCWTAAECTIRFMWPVIASDGFFGDAIERIWKKRIGMLKERQSELVTDELLKWESDLNKAFEEPEMYQKIRETNIRYNAITHLTQLLKDHWTLLGCSTLESEARKMFLKRKDPPNAKVNQQEQEHEPNLKEGDITVARELKDLLLEIQGVINLSTRQEQEPQADEANKSESGGGEDHNEAENSQRTSSSSSSKSVRPHLTTPVPLNVSPLKKATLRNPHPRRKMKFWSPEEVEALREGVKEYGKAWKDIKNSNPVVFADRTEVDLKDKWRNLVGRNN